MENLISVIVPVHNVREYLPDCLDSIVAQTYRNIEIIVIDDGSTDGGETLCDLYAGRDSRITVVHQKQQGLSGARNTGLTVAKGSLVAFIDSDDVIDPDMLQVLCDGMERTQADVSMVSCCYLMPDGSRQAVNISLVGPDGLYITDGRRLALMTLADDQWRLGAVWNKLYRRSVIADERFAQTAAEDLEFNLRVLRRTGRAVVVNRPLYHWRQRPASLSRLKVFPLRLLQTHLLCLDGIDADDTQLKAACLNIIYDELPGLRYWYGRTELNTDAAHAVGLAYAQTRNQYLANTAIPAWKKIRQMIYYHLPFTYAAYVALGRWRAALSVSRLSSMLRCQRNKDARTS
ncbi:MAG: glycosyltransferase [Prevotella sp.]|nr:glycosyltransferase [Prevotella sp.]